MTDTFKIFDLPLIIIVCILVISIIILSIAKKNIKTFLIGLIYCIIIFATSFIVLRDNKKKFIDAEDSVYPVVYGPLSLTQLNDYYGECDPSSPNLEIFVQYAASVTNIETQNESDKIYSDIIKILSTKNPKVSFILNLPDQDPGNTVTLWVGYPSIQVFDSNVKFTSLTLIPKTKNITYTHEITKPESRSTITGIPPACKNTYILHDKAGNLFPSS